MEIRVYKAVVIYCILCCVMLVISAKPCKAESDFKYSMTEEGVLTVEGEGKLEKKGFYHLDDSIRGVKSVVVGEGITEIGPACFEAFRSTLEEVTLPNSLRTISEGGFFVFIS